MFIYTTVIFVQCDLKKLRASLVVQQSSVREQVVAVDVLTVIHGDACSMK